MITLAALWLPILLIHIGSQVKSKQSQSYKFREFVKTLNILILKNIGLPGKPVKHFLTFFGMQNLFFCEKTF